MNIFGNWIFSFFMAAGSSFSAIEETFPLKEERVFDAKEKKSFSYVAGSTGIYPSPSFAIGRRTKSLGEARDFSIGVSYVPSIPQISQIPEHFIQGYARWGYYKDRGSEGAYRGPGIGIGVTLPLITTIYAWGSPGASVQQIPEVLITCMCLKPSYTIGKEYETYFSQLDLTVSAYPGLIAMGFPAVVPTITYEIGMKF